MGTVSTLPGYGYADSAKVRRSVPHEAVEIPTRPTPVRTGEAASDNVRFSEREPV